MRIDGRSLASDILANLSKNVAKLKQKGITPTLAIILMGDNEASATYVRQKEIKAKEIGAEVKLFHFGSKITNEKIEKLIKKLDKDPKIHGIILQRPAPERIKADKLTELVPPIKEVDGFGSKSSYPVPVAEAVLVMLKNVHKQSGTKKDFSSWLKSQKIVVIGRGETAGKPIIDLLTRISAKPEVVDSHTKNKEKLLKNASIIVSAVGKHILDSSQVKKGAILIGVGLYSNKEGKLKGDYDDEDMENVASYFSPTPGGVGPVNVACLMENLVKAANNPTSNL